MKKLVTFILFTACLIGRAQTNWTYSTNLFGAGSPITFVYIGTNSTDTNRDSLYRMMNSVNHSFYELQQRINDGLTNYNFTSNQVSTINLTVTNLLGTTRPYQTNVTLAAATTLQIYFTAFPDLTTNYTVTAPNDLLGVTTTVKATNSFTLSFTAATLTAQVIEGAVIHK